MTKAASTRPTFVGRFFAADKYWLRRWLDDGEYRPTKIMADSEAGDIAADKLMLFDVEED
jgi:hypothetical protein